MPRFSEIASFMKTRGFAYPSSDIYGGLQGAYDYGPLGAAMKRNLAAAWWQSFVHRPPGRGTVYPMDSSVILAPKVWEASGHVGGFSDPLSECTACKKRSRTDHLVEEATHTKLTTSKIEELVKIVEGLPQKLQCPHCKKVGSLLPPREFNLLMTTRLGPAVDTSSLAYLRPETAQGAFINLNNLWGSSYQRAALPFGVAQIGRAFRNEVTPGNYIFRTREFDQLELQWIYNPTLPFNLTTKKMKSEPSSQAPPPHRSHRHKHEGGEDVVSGDDWDEEEGPSGGKAALGSTTDELHHRYWIAECLKFCIHTCGLRPENLRVRWHSKEELAHYSQMTADIEYRYPFGWGEMWGIANRGDYDVRRHEKASKTKSPYGPNLGVVEPSLGLNRLLLACVCDSYYHEREKEQGKTSSSSSSSSSSAAAAGGGEEVNRIVLRLASRVAPFKAAVFPLVMADVRLVRLAKQLVEAVATAWRDPRVTHDFSSASVGKRYRRQDEIGTKWCLTVDNTTVRDQTVSVRERDSRRQLRVSIRELVNNEACLESLDFSKAPAILEDTAQGE